MPRALKYCSHMFGDGNHCLELVPGGVRHCAAHQTRWDIARSKADAQRLTPALRRRVMQRDSHTCVYCGEPATEVDHIVAKAHGGSDEDSNLVAACHDCNEAKRKREALESRLA